MKVFKTQLLTASIALGSLTLLAQNSDKISNFVEQLKKLKGSLNYPLYAHEAARCSSTDKANSEDCRHAENEEFEVIGKEVLTAQTKLAQAQARLLQINAEVSGTTEMIQEIGEVISHNLNINDIKDVPLTINSLAQLLAKQTANYKALVQVIKTQRQDLEKNIQNIEVKNHRVFHAKQHACLTATLRLTSTQERKKMILRLQHGNSPVTSQDLELINRGLFQTNDESKKEYKAIIRLSSGLGIIYPDIIPDVKGLAIKLLDVQDGNEKKSVDLLMTSGPNPFGNSLRDFADFMQATVKYIEFTPYASPIDALTFIKTNKLTQHFTKEQKVPEVTSINSRKSFSQLKFWSGHPYLLKSATGEESAMKFNTFPQVSTEQSNNLLNARGEEASVQDLLHSNHLRQDLVGRFSKGHTLKYDFNLQLEKDPQTTPIESTVIEWKEANSPSIKVAELIIEPQNFDQSAIDELCEQANFTPAHFHSQHRPLSNMGRGRIIAYRASQLGRALSGELSKELTLADYNELIKLNTINKSDK